MNREVAAVFAILLPILVVLVIVRRRRLDVVVTTPAATVPPRRRPIHWYIAANGKLSWWQEQRDGSIERGPFFAPGLLLYFLDNQGLWDIREAMAEGYTPGDLVQYFNNVMCYWPVADPRLGEDVKSSQVVAAMERGLELLLDDLANFRHTGKPDPFFAPSRATSRLRREANDDGSWLLAADLLRDIEKHHLLGPEVWASRVADLIKALS